MRNTLKSVWSVIDDGSKDNTYRIVCDYAKDKANYIVHHQENGGVCVARNKGLDLATGDYIMFVDADDYLSPVAIEFLYNDIYKNDADVACALMSDGINSAGLNKEKTVQVWIGQEPLIKALQDNEFTYSSCAKLFKKQALRGLQFVEGRKIHEDSFFVFCCFEKAHKVTVREEYLYNYRNNEGSASHAKFSDKFYDILYFAEQKEKIVKKNYPELMPLAYNVLVKANISMLQCFLNTKEKRYRKDVRQCITTVKKHKKHFIPSFVGDKKRFFIITNNLYPLFRLMYQIKYAKRLR